MIYIGMMIVIVGYGLSYSANPSFNNKFWHFMWFLAFIALALIAGLSIDICKNKLDEECMMRRTATTWKLTWKLDNSKAVKTLYGCSVAIVICQVVFVLSLAYINGRKRTS
jgi:hypothetical protein